MAVGIKDIMAYFEMSVADFGKQWRELDDEDKAQIKAGIENGTFTY